MLSATVMFGNSAYDWKTMPTLRWLGERRVMSLPSTVIVPAVGCSKPGDHPQRRRLAAAGRAEERHELAALGGQVEVEHGGDVAEPLLDAGQSSRKAMVVLVLLAGAGDGDAAPRAATDEAR